MNEGHDKHDRCRKVAQDADCYEQKDEERRQQEENDWKGHCKSDACFASLGP